MSSHRFPLWLAAVGLAVIAVYLAATTGLLPSTTNVALSAVFAIGPVAIVGVLSIHRRLSAQQPGLLLQAATVFLIVAFALFTLMLVVQQTIALQFADLRVQAGAGASGDALRSIQRGVNLVQLGTDVTFDIFYCVGVVLLGAALYKTERFGRVLSASGIVAAAALLVANLATFPYVPAESGFVDLGPVTGVWWMLVIARLWFWDRDRRQQPSER